MYSKLFCFATFALTVLCAGACTVRAPWSEEPIGREVNFTFTMRNNLIYLPSATIDGRTGNYLFGSSQPVSVLDTQFATAAVSHTLQLNRRKSLPFTAVTDDLHGFADAIIGANVWGSSAVTIDYRARLITLQLDGIHPELMTVFRYTSQPMITVTVDGQSIPAVVDTTLPDTLVLPGTTRARRDARVQIAGVDFGTINVRSGDVEVARVGNRLLSRFLISIDYGRRVVGLWQDPRAEL